jgi:hypothetical protein
LKTSDGGLNWDAQSSGTNQLLVSVFSPAIDTGFIVGNKTVLKATEGDSIGFLIQSVLGMILYQYILLMLTQATLLEMRRSIKQPMAAQLGLNNYYLVRVIGSIALLFSFLHRILDLSWVGTPFSKPQKAAGSLSPLMNQTIIPTIFT